VEKYGEHLSGTIRRFHQRHYHPNKMAVSLVGPQPIEQLREMAERHFSNIASLHPVDDAVAEQTAALPVEVLVRDKSLFTHGGGKLIKLRPVKDLRDMTVVWELPVTTHLYRRSPCSLISYLLAYKGEGSLFAALQDKQWATSVAAGVRTEFEDFTLFEATFSLTEEGLRHWEEVMALLYRSIDVLAQAGDVDLMRYWTEMRTINALDFQYREKTSAYELAPQLSSHMLDYPPEHIISAGWLMDERVDLPLVREFIAKLVPDKSLVFLRSKTFVDSPLNLGNDDATYLDKKAFVDYAKHLLELAVSVSADGSPDSTATAETSLSEAELEASKRSGEYFRNLRRYQDAVYERAAESHAADGGVQRMEPFYGIPYNIEDLRVLPHAPGEGPESIAAIQIKLPPENHFVCTELIDSKGAESSAGAAEDWALEEPARHARPLRSAAPVPVSPRGLDAGEVWHSRDEVFGQPRSIFFHLLPSESCGKSAFQCISVCSRSLTTLHLCYVPMFSRRQGTDTQFSR
jgi:secreted Zn-dependent insulinase-like peptidase